jgi:hypothetical protein
MSTPDGREAVMLHADYLNELIEEAYQTAREKGWHAVELTTERAVVASEIALIHDEVSEAFAVWSDNDEGFTPQLLDELADVALRTASLLGAVGATVERGQGQFGWWPAMNFDRWLLELHYACSVMVKALREKHLTVREAVVPGGLLLLARLYEGASKVANEVDGRPFAEWVQDKAEHNRQRPWRHGGVP